MNLSEFLAPRSALYLPASNARAIEKARELPSDMVILDLEDAVKPGDKEAARKAAFEAISYGFSGKTAAIRVNGPETQWHRDDLEAVSASSCDLFVLPKVEEACVAADIAKSVGKPLLTMIETPRGVLRAVEIASAQGIAGLIAGTNDLANALHLLGSSDRAGLGLSLQLIVLAARAAGIWAIDGVFNDLADPDGFAAQCSDGRALGFDGKTLIHPGQIEVANRVFSPTQAELEDARALVAAASGGAERFRDRMIETMHVEMARRLIARAESASTPI